MATLVGLFILGRDAELRTTQNGEQVANLALAYNYGRKGQDGKMPTQWIEASFWGERAAKMASYLTKGTQFFIQLDDIHVETYDKRDGGQGAKLVGRVNNIEFTLRDKGERQQAAPAPAPRPAPPPPRQPAPRSAGGSGFEDMDDDIPFRDPLSYRGQHLVL